MRLIYFTANAKLSRLFWSTFPFSSGFKPKRISSSPASFNDCIISSVTKSPLVYILVCIVLSDFLTSFKNSIHLSGYNKGSPPVIPTDFIFL